MLPEHVAACCRAWGPMGVEDGQIEGRQKLLCDRTSQYVQHRHMTRIYTPSVTTCWSLVLRKSAIVGWGATWGPAGGSLILHAWR